MRKIRLQVALAKAGVASRRKAAGIIASGRVRVNGKVVRERGFRVDASKDKIALDKKGVSFEEGKRYYILNKPPGVLSTVEDKFGRKKVSDYVRGVDARLYPVGRLDKDTTGLIILTNDGDLTYRLTHPKFGVRRVYEVRVKGAMEKEDLRRLKKGIVIEGKLAKAEKALLKKEKAGFTVALVTLREGRKREVRRMFEALRRELLTLKRIAYGPVRLKGLREGSLRPLAKDEIKKLKTCVGLK
jgi:pseudouridine synthase